LAGEGSGEWSNTMTDDEDYIINDGEIYTQPYHHWSVSLSLTFWLCHAGEEGSGGEWSSGEVDQTMTDNEDYATRTVMPI